MSARGILHNPGLFAGHTITPISAVINWLNIYHTNFFWFHHHLVFMCDRLLSKNAKNTFNQLRNASDVIHFLESQFDIPNVLPSNRTLGKEFNGTKSTYYQNVAKQKNVLSQSEDFMENSFNLFE